MTISILGIDISKLKCDVALIRGDKFKSKVFPNNLAGFEAISEWLKQLDIHSLHACMEATSTYGDALAHYLFDQGFTVSVMNPTLIKHYGESELKRNKTDKSDAKLIAKFCAEKKPRPWIPLPLPIRQLQAMVRRLESLSDLHNQEQNRLETADSSVVPSLEKVIHFLEAEIKLLKKQINQHIDNHPNLKSDKDLLISIPSVGDFTSAQTIAFIGDVTRFKGTKQIVAFLGMNPEHKKSGTSLNSVCISRRGDSMLRKAFYMPAIGAIRFNPILREFAENLRKKGKRPKVIICAVMRKLIHIIYGVLTSRIPFDPQYLMKNA